MSEPFPLLNTASDQLHNAGAGIPRQRRRKSSALGAEIRGDTGAPAMATSRASMGMTEGTVS
jgi:acyl-CoA-dependent ceramide synthase